MKRGKARRSRILAGITAGVMTVSLLFSMAGLGVHADETQETETGGSGEETQSQTYTYSTGQEKTSTTASARSREWKQTSDNTWTMDIDGDGTADVTLVSEINAETGNQEWTYTFNVEDDEQAYYVYEEMTSASGGLPLPSGYSSTGVAGKKAAGETEGSGTSGGDSGTSGGDAGTSGDGSGTSGEGSGTSGGDSGTSGDGSGTSGGGSGTSGGDSGTSGDGSGTSGEGSGTSGGESGTDAGIDAMAIPQEPGKTATGKKSETEPAYTITNTKSHTTTPVAGTGTLVISKTVTGTMPDPDQKFSFTVTLEGSNSTLKKKIEGAQIFGDVAFVDGVGKVSVGSGESKTIVNLPPNLAYTITEDDVDGYTNTSKTNDTGTIAADTTVTSEWTNASSYTPRDIPEGDPVSITLEKKVTGAGAPSQNVWYSYQILFENLKTATEYTYTISRAGGGVSGSVGSGTGSGSGADSGSGTGSGSGSESGGGTGSGSGSESGGGTGSGSGSESGSGTGSAETTESYTFKSSNDGTADVSLFLAKDDKAEFKGIPVGTAYQILEDGGEYTGESGSRTRQDGNFQSSYSLTNSSGQGSSTGTIVSSLGTAQENTSLSTAKETADKEEEVAVVFTNNYPATQSLTVRKFLRMDVDGTEVTSDKDSEAYQKLTDEQKKTVDEKAAAKEFEFTITFSNMEAGTSFSSPLGRITPDEDGECTKTFRLRGNGLQADGTQLVFQDIPSGVQYVVKESAAPVDEKARVMYQPSYSIATKDMHGNAITGTVASASGSAGSGSPLSTAKETVEDNQSDTVTFVNEEQPLPQNLPTTGGEGILRWLIAAGILGAAYAAVVIAGRHGKKA